MTNTFPPELVAINIAHCDERIASLESKIDLWKPWETMMKFCEGLYDDDKNKDIFRNAPNQDEVKNLKNDLELVKTEKLIYKCLTNEKTVKAFYPRLLAKYDELMGLSYDLSGNMVINNMVLEGDHLEYCKESLNQREYIRKLCLIGEKA
jgi:hypothetical protein